MLVTIPQSIRGLMPRDLFSPASWGPHALFARGTIPALCYDACNGAYQIAQSVGKSDSLCQKGSSFQNAYALCEKCLEANAGATKDTVKNYVQPQFEQFISFCAGGAPDPANESSSSSSTTKPATTSSPCSTCSTILITDYRGEVLTATLGAQEITASLSPVTVTQINTVTYYQPDTVDSASTSSPPQPTESSKPNDTSSGVKPSEIAGPVVPTVVVVVVLGFLGFRWHKKRRKTQMALRVARGEEEEEKGYKKAELPDDNRVRSVFYELEGSAPPQVETAEMTANEPPAHEMPTEEQSHEDLENQRLRS